jgi:hypothetical protein
MRPPRLRPRADPLSSALETHAFAEDQRREAERVTRALRERAEAARAEARERRRRGEEILRRGDDGWGLSLLDSAAAAEAEAREAEARLAKAGREARQLAAAERVHRAGLFVAIDRFLAEAGEGR